MLNLKNVVYVENTRQNLCIFNKNQRQMTNWIKMYFIFNKGKQYLHKVQKCRKKRDKTGEKSVKTIYYAKITSAALKCDVNDCLQFGKPTF